MQTQDIQSFNDGERRLLDSAFDPEAGGRRARNIMLGGLMLAVFAAVVAAWSLTEGLLLAVLVLYVAVVTIEKIAQARSIDVWRTLVQKLVRRVEHLEGVPLTPDSGRPTSVEKRTELPVMF
jgi:hypothetical protein